ncbi:hypothetical protein EIP91_000697 [Steccherinum ochraceum]|uniref:Uncharacterized protein n=1 Tax=Steccherinum ochraceum TaxID=92696 RepID=A0A4R0RT20_9APHY|nr:hypothetical protein EIP91_000697 [Steccherinum ochraceum]
MARRYIPPPTPKVIRKPEPSKADDKMFRGCYTKDDMAKLPTQVIRHYAMRHQVSINLPKEEILNQLYADRKYIFKARHAPNFRTTLLEDQLCEKYDIPWRDAKKEQKVLATSFAMVWQWGSKREKTSLNWFERALAKRLAKRREEFAHKPGSSKIIDKQYIKMLTFRCRRQYYAGLPPGVRRFFSPPLDPRKPSRKRFDSPCFGAARDQLCAALEEIEKDAVFPGRTPSYIKHIALPLEFGFREPFFKLPKALHSSEHHRIPAHRLPSFAMLDDTAYQHCVLVSPSQLLSRRKHKMSYIGLPEAVLGRCADWSHTTLLVLDHASRESLVEMRVSKAQQGSSSRLMTTFANDHPIQRLHRPRTTVQPEGIQKAKRRDTPHVSVRYERRDFSTPIVGSSQRDRGPVPEGSRPRRNAFVDLLINAPGSPPATPRRTYQLEHQDNQPRLPTPSPEYEPPQRRDTPRPMRAPHLQPFYLSDPSNASGSRRSRSQSNSPPAPARLPSTPSPPRATMRSQRSASRTSPSPPPAAPVEAGSDDRMGREENEDDQQGEQQPEGDQDGQPGDQDEQPGDPPEYEDSWDVPLPEWSFGARSGDGDDQDDWTDESAAGGGGGGGNGDGGPPGGGGGGDDGSSSDDDDDEGQDEGRAKERGKKSEKNYFDSSDLTVDIPPLLLQSKDDLRYRDIALVYPPKGAQATNPKWLDAMGSRIVAERQSLVKLQQYVERELQIANADLDVALVELNDERVQFHELVDTIRGMSGNVAADEFLALAHSKLEEKEKDDMNHTKVWDGIYNFRTAHPDPLLYDPASSSPVKDTEDESYQSFHMPPPSDGPRPDDAPSSSPSGDGGPGSGGGRIFRSANRNKTARNPNRPPSDEDFSGKKSKRAFSSIREPADNDDADPDLARPTKLHRRIGREFACVFDDKYRDVALKDRLVVQNGLTAEDAESLFQHPPRAHWQFGDRPVVPLPNPTQPAAPAQEQLAALPALPNRPRLRLQPQPQPDLEDRPPHVDDLPPPRRRRRRDSDRPSARPGVVRRRIHAAPANAEAGPSGSRSRSGSVQPPPVFMAPPPPVAGPSDSQVPRAAPVFFLPPAAVAAGPSAPQAEPAAPFPAEPGSSMTGQEVPAPPASTTAPGHSSPQSQDNANVDQANESEVEGGHTSFLATLGDMAAGMIPSSFRGSLAFQMPTWPRATQSQQQQENQGVAGPFPTDYEEPISPPSENYTAVNNSFVAKRRGEPIN